MEWLGMDNEHRKKTTHTMTNTPTYQSEREMALFPFNRYNTYTYP